MISGIRFPTFRLIVLALLILSQVYLFLRIRKAIQSSQWSSRFKSWAVPLVAIAIGLLFAMSGYILFKPIPWLDPPWIAQAIFFYFPPVWGFGSVLSALLLGFIHLAGMLTRMVSRGPSPVHDPDRRYFLQAGMAGLATAPFILSGYGATYASKSYEIRQVTVPFGRSLRVVQLTDIHAGIYMTRKDLRRYADQVITLDPDLFVLTGDFISNSMAFLPECMEEMARVRARYGAFAVLGNHERWYGRQHDLQTIFRQYGIQLLINTHQMIETEQGPFAVAGIDDLRTGHPDLEAALLGLDSATPALLLSHRPEIFPQAATHDVPLTLAGHWHGGQIKLKLPGGGISVAHLRTPYPEGLYRINASRLYVSRGIGTTFTPIRLNVPPEITLLHLTQ
jgi:predicted MPP superfamily phosphohydrolase